MQQPNSKAQKILTVIKWAVAIFFILSVLTAISIKSFLSAIAFTIISLLLLPPLRNFLVSILPFLANKPVKFAAIVLFTIIGMIGWHDPNRGTSRQSTSHSKENRLSIKDYIEKNRSSDIALKNVDFLADCERTFNYTYGKDVSYDYMWQLGDNNLKRYRDTVTKEDYFLFTPDYYLGFNYSSGDTLVSWKYLKSIETDDTLVNYSLVNYCVEFVVDRGDRVKAVYPVLICRNNKTNTIHRLISKTNIQDMDLSKLALNEDLAAQRKLVAEWKADVEQKANEKIRKNEQDEHFKEHCLSAWDGSCPPLVDYVKEHMNDPESFEHVETDFWNADDHAVVLMRFRGKNAFGGKVINSIKANVSWDGKLLEIYQ